LWVQKNLCISRLPTALSRMASEGAINQWLDVAFALEREEFMIGFSTFEQAKAYQMKILRVASSPRESSIMYG
jgi:hypothetical protein